MCNVIFLKSKFTQKKSMMNKLSKLELKTHQPITSGYFTTLHYYATETLCLQTVRSSRPAAIRSPAGQVLEH